MADSNDPTDLVAAGQAREQEERDRNTAYRRLDCELRALCRDPPDNISAGPTSDSRLEWIALLMIPPDRNTPYAHGIFSLKITFPVEYPRVAPEVRLLTKMHHPNVGEDGEISGLGILYRQNWSPVMTIGKIVLYFEVLLLEPDLEQVLNPEAAIAYVEDRGKFEETARDWTRRFAMGGESQGGDGEEEFDEKKAVLQ